MQSRRARLARVARSEAVKPVRVAQTVPLARSLRAAPGVRIRRARIVPLDAVVPVVVRSRRARAVLSARLRWLTSCRVPKAAGVPAAAAVPVGVARHQMVAVVRVGMDWLPAVVMMLLAAVPARAVPLGIVGVSSALQSR